MALGFATVAERQRLQAESTHLPGDVDDVGLVEILVYRQLRHGRSDGRSGQGGDPVLAPLTRESMVLRGFRECDEVLIEILHLELAHSVVHDLRSPAKRTFPRNSSASRSPLSG